MSHKPYKFHDFQVVVEDSLSRELHWKEILQQEISNLKKCIDKLVIVSHGYTDAESYPEAYTDLISREIVEAMRSLSIFASAHGIDLAEITWEHDQEMRNFKKAGDLE